jgi:hypothetical protein
MITKTKIGLLQEIHKMQIDCINASRDGVSHDYILYHLKSDNMRSLALGDILKDFVDAGLLNKTIGLYLSGLDARYRLTTPDEIIRFKLMK